MRYKLGIIAVFVFTVIAVCYIQTSPLFAALDNKCTCVDLDDATETCDIYCGYDDESCLIVYLLTPKGACLSSNQCLTKWYIECRDEANSVYWQHEDCFHQCWWI